jgi:hypothetical protein
MVRLFRAPGPYWHAMKTHWQPLLEDGKEKRTISVINLQAIDLPLIYDPFFVATPSHFQWHFVAMGGPLRTERTHGLMDGEPWT